jgi:dephospho-CoA kinase
MPKIIGLVGGVASGKSTVGRVLEKLGCVVIDSDALSREAYRDPLVLRAVADVAGQDVIRADGTPDRGLLATRIFADHAIRRGVEAIIHPWVARRRATLMASATNARAIVWDSPLLLETGLNNACDTIWFVDTPDDVRQARAFARGWPPGERERREKSQWDLARKRAAADETIIGTLPQEQLRERLGLLLDRLGSAR